MKNYKKLKKNTNLISGKNLKSKKFQSPSTTINTNRLKIFKVVLLLVMIFFLGSIFTILIYTKYNIYEYREINMSVRIQNGSSSFNTSTEELNFARIYPGGEVAKKIQLHSLIRSRVRIEKEGNISDFIYVSDNNFIIQDNETRQLEVSLIVPADALEGAYNGKLKIYFLKR